MGKAGRKPYNYFIHQEIYVLVDEVKRQQKLKSTREAIYRFFETDKFKDLAAGKPYQIFIDSLLRNTKDRLEDYQDQTMHNRREIQTDMEENNHYCVDPETGKFLTKEDQIKLNTYPDIKTRLSFKKIMTNLKEQRLRNGETKQRNY